MHAIKMLVVCAVNRKFSYEVATFVENSSGIIVWKEQRLTQLISIESGVLS